MQDLGREGYRSAGIGTGGAMDRVAAATANYLVGNDAGAAVIEMHFPAAELVFNQAAVISITGGDFSAMINSVPVALWVPVVVSKGDCLAFKKYMDGARVYLGLQGGFQITPWLGSNSTHTGLQMGGHQGRRLAKDDVLFFKNEQQVKPPFVTESILPYLSSIYHENNFIRCISGAEWLWLEDDSKKLFTSEVYTITPQSDRMGYRLHGAALHITNQAPMISSPVDAGIIQLLPNGQMIVLMADHPTTGGYPRVAGITRADRARLAQLAVNKPVQFELIGIENAEEALLSMYQTLEVIKKTCSRYYDHD